MSWYSDVADYIGRNLELFIEQFFPESRPAPYGTGIRLNPSPCCGHNDCFSFSRSQNTAFCFSCGHGGTRIQIVEALLGEERAKRELEKWSGIHYVPYREGLLVKGDAELQAYRLQKRVLEIADKAVQFYHARLLTTPDALEKQTGTNQAAGQRGHTIEGLKAFKVGLSGDYQRFHKAMQEAGYSNDELKAAGKLIWVPEGYFVYPYYDVKGSLVRLNTKLWYRSCQNCDYTTFDLSKETKAEHEANTKHEMSKDGYSTGDKTRAFYFPLGHLRGRKKGILIEGENDAISTWEALQQLPRSYGADFVPVGIGGRMEDSAFREPFLRQFDALYEAFDNDEAGEAYRKELDAKVPDVPVYTIAQDPDFKDIDQYLKSNLSDSEQFKMMIDTANFVDTNAYLIERNGFQHCWHLKNRKFRIEFTIDKFNTRMDQLEGTMLIFKNGQMVDKKIGGVDKIKVDASLTYAKLALSEHLNLYYNEVPWVRDAPKRSFWELRDILLLSKEYFQVIKQLAWYLFKADKLEYEKKIKNLQDKLNQKIVAEVLKEVNGFQNDTIDPNMLFPRLQLSQFFHVGNDDAFFYYSRVVREGDMAKLVPCLLSNKREEIRLDLMKRKDPQCLLLVNNRYELPFEVPNAVMDSIEVSLQPYWAEKWRNNELDESEYEPAKLIVEIENFIRRCYYTTDEIMKVLALWIYATYFYMLFRDGFPYLIFNGPKGSGKSTFDTIVYLLSLNAKFALDMTESALFRTISFEGGTFILDEIEDLVDKRSVNSSDYAKILKGGYADLGYVYRMDMDLGRAERFSVFGPKVISNINGIEDVIGDRCIYVKTTQAPERELAKLERVQMYKDERRSEVHSITSRCAISALSYFQDVNRLFNSERLDSRLSTGNARLTQILRPLLTIANFVGGDYATHLMSYYDRELKAVKDEIAASTTEGMITTIFKRIAEELTEINKEKWATDYNRHLYQEPIAYNPNSGVFEVDTLHLKILCEEINDGGDPLDIKLINSTVKTVLGSKIDVRAIRRQTTATIEDENLRRQLDGKRYIRVYRYFLNVDQFIDRARVKNPNKAESSLF